MFLGIANAISGIKSGGLSFIKDNLKLYLDFKSSKSDTLKFPSEGSTSFDGNNDYIDTGYSTNHTNISVSMWFKKDALGSFKRLFDDTNTSYASNLQINITDANIIKVRSGNGSNSETDIDTTYTISASNWHHLVVTRENLAVKIYVDGDLKKSGNVSAFSAPLVSWKIGSSGTGTTNFDGKIANVGLWSRVLTPEEVQSIMNKSYSQLKGVEKTSLVSWWGLDNTDYMRANVSTFMNNTASTVGTWNLADGVMTVSSHNAYRYFNSFINASLYSGANAYIRLEVTAKKTSGSPVLEFEGTTSFDLTTEYQTYTIDVNYEESAGDNFFRVPNASGTDQVLITAFNAYPFGSKDSHGNNNGNNYKMKPTTSVYGGNAPILPRAVDVAKEGQADAIGDGSALFNGSSDYVEVADSDLLDVGSADFTFTAWVYLDDASENYIISKGDADNHIGFRINGNRRISYEFEVSTVNKTPTDDGSQITLNEWTHIALVVDRDGKTYRYVNGINTGTNDTLSGNTNSLNTSAVFNIGKKYSGFHYFDGNLSQVGFWQGALTQSQIQSVMESTSYSKIPADVKSTLGSELSGSDIDFTLSGTQSASTTGTYWITEGNWTISDGKAIYDNSGNSAITVASATIEDAGTYKLTFEISDASSQGQIKFKAGSTTLIDTALYSNGSHTLYLNIASSLGSAQVFKIDGKTGGSSFKIDNISIKKVTNDIVAYYPLDGSSEVK